MRRRSNSLHRASLLIFVIRRLEPLASEGRRITLILTAMTREVSKLSHNGHQGHSTLLGQLPRSVKSKGGSAEVGRSTFRSTRSVNGSVTTSPFLPPTIWPSPKS